MPTIWTAARDSSWIAKAKTAERAGSRVATAAARAAGTWRRAATIAPNGSRVPTTITASARRMSSAVSSWSVGKLQRGWTTSQNSVAKPKAQTRVT